MNDIPAGTKAISVTTYYHGAKPNKSTTSMLVDHSLSAVGHLVFTLEHELVAWKATTQYRTEGGLTVDVEVIR